MPGVATLGEHASHGGVQGFYRHESSAIGLPMRFGVFRPPTTRDAPLPAVFYLAGLTCTHETFAMKAGAQRYAAERGIVLVMPDTSPRDTGVAGADDDWEFGDAAGFYLDATQDPWRERWRMGTYVADELPALVASEFGVDPARIGICGHSMGGHGALTLALTRPDRFRSVSAFAPIAAPMDSPWGSKAFTGYLGADRAGWTAHDASRLVAGGARTSPILVDQGLADRFLPAHLGIDAFEAACRGAGQPLTLRRHAGYDHSYYFIATFVRDHLAHHAAELGVDARG